MPCQCFNPGGKYLQVQLTCAVFFNVMSWQTSAILYFLKSKFQWPIWLGRPVFIAVKNFIRKKTPQLPFNSRFPGKPKLTTPLPSLQFCSSTVSVVGKWHRFSAIQIPFFLPIQHRRNIEGTQSIDLHQQDCCPSMLVLRPLLTGLLSLVLAPKVLVPQLVVSVLVHHWTQDNDTWIIPDSSVVRTWMSSSAASDVNRSWAMTRWNTCESQVREA